MGLEPDGPEIGSWWLLIDEEPTFGPYSTKGEAVVEMLTLPPPWSKRVQVAQVIALPE
jgi:hypothetical protein